MNETKVGDKLDDSCRSKRRKNAVRKLEKILDENRYAVAEGRPDTGTKGRNAGQSILVNVKSGFYNPEVAVGEELQKRLEYETKCGAVKTRDDLIGQKVIEAPLDLTSKVSLMKYAARHLMAYQFVKSIVRMHWRQPELISDKQAEALRRIIAWDAEAAAQAKEGA